MSDIKKPVPGATVTGNNGQSKPDKDTGFSTPANGDIFTLRAIFGPVEADLTAMFRRKLDELQRLETDLGRPTIFDLTEARQREMHATFRTLKNDLEVLYAAKDYLEYMTEFSIETWGRISGGYLELQTRHNALKELLSSEMDTNASILQSFEIFINQKSGK